MPKKAGKSIEKFNTPCLMLFCAKTKSGKTYFMKYVLRNFMKSRKFDWGIVICPSAYSGNKASWYGYVDDQYLFNESMNKDDLTKLIENVIEQQKIFTEEGHTKQVFIVIDDIYGTYKLDLPIFTKLATSGRQYNISTLFAVHKFTKELSMMVREQAGYVFVFRSMVNDPTVRSLYDLYSACSTKFNDWRELKQFIIDNTNNYGVVCIDNNAAGTQDAVYAMQAPNKQEKFKLKF